jgi:hypothetical protein
MCAAIVLHNVFRVLGRWKTYGKKGEYLPDWFANFGAEKRKTIRGAMVVLLRPLAPTVKGYRGMEKWVRIECCCLCFCTLLLQRCALSL